MFLNSNFEISYPNGGCDAQHSHTMFLNSNFEISHPNGGVHRNKAGPQPAADVSS